MNQACSRKMLQRLWALQSVRGCIKPSSWVEMEEMPHQKATKNQLSFTFATQPSSMNISTWNFQQKQPSMIFYKLQPTTSSPLSLLHRLHGPITPLQWDTLASVYLQVSLGILSWSGAKNSTRLSTLFFGYRRCEKGDWRWPSRNRKRYVHFWILGCCGNLQRPLRFFPWTWAGDRSALRVILATQQIEHMRLSLSAVDAIQWAWLVTCVTCDSAPKNLKNKALPNMRSRSWSANRQSF